MIFFIGETHRALHFGGGVNKLPQRIAGQGMIIAADADEFEMTGFVMMPFRIAALEELAFAGRATDVLAEIQSLVGTFGTAPETLANWNSS